MNEGSPSRKLVGVPLVPYNMFVVNLDLDMFTWGLHNDCVFLMSVLWAREQGLSRDEPHKYLFAPPPQYVSTSQYRVFATDTTNDPNEPYTYIVSNETLKMNYIGQGLHSSVSSEPSCLYLD